jgi:hypothetical protein
MTADERTAVEVNIKYLDVADRRNPERSGRYIPLAKLMAFVNYVKDEPDGMDQLSQLLSAIAREG